ETGDLEPRGAARRASHERVLARRGVRVERGQPRRDLTESPLRPREVERRRVLDALSVAQDRVVTELEGHGGLLRGRPRGRRAGAGVGWRREERLQAA